MTEKRKSQILLYGSLAVILILASLLVNYGRPLLIRYNGIGIYPGADYAGHALPENIDYYHQQDSGWGKEALGGSEDFTVGSSGCLVACIAAALDYMGVEADPSTVNAAFQTHQVFNEEGEVLWMNIKLAYPQVDYRYSNDFSSKDINADLDAGLLPIVKVKYNGTGVYHWLLVVGTEGNEYMVMDPLADENPIPLSKHGKVYAYRVLYPVSGASATPTEG